MSTQVVEHPASQPVEEQVPVSAQERKERKERDDNERQELFDAFGRQNLRRRNIDPVVLTWMIAMHIGLLTAPFFFAWKSLAVAVVLHWLTCSIGVCLGYHRLLSHCSLKVKSPVRFFTTLCGVLSGQGTPLMWSAVHRLHHGRSDKKGDPHSPREGVWWSHMLWLFVNHNKQQRELLYRTYTPDLINDPMLRFFERTYMGWQVAFAGLLFVMGGWSLLLWGVCARIVLGYHTTWLINSASHLWGYQSYETADDSRNLWWAGLLAYGEGWHNNHHAWPHVACYGHRWWEFDITWQAIKVLRFLGLASDVDDRIPEPGSTPMQS